MHCGYMSIMNLLLRALNMSSMSLTGNSPVLPTPTIVWEFETTSVGSSLLDSGPSPVQMGSVGSPIWGSDRTGGFTSTTPSSCESVRESRGIVALPLGEPDVGTRHRTHLSPCPRQISTDSGRDGTTMVVTSPGDRLSQALNGGSRTALASFTVAVTTVVDSGAHVVSGLVLRRARSLRTFLPSQPRRRVVIPPWPRRALCQLSPRQGMEPRS